MEGAEANRCEHGEQLAAFATRLETELAAIRDRLAKGDEERRHLVQTAFWRPHKSLSEAEKIGVPKNRKRPVGNPGTDATSGPFRLT